MRNHLPRVCASSKAESGDADDVIMSDQRGSTTQVYTGLNLVHNIQMRD